MFREFRQQLYRKINWVSLLGSFSTSQPQSRAVEGKRRLKTSGPSLDPEPHSRGGGGVLEPPIPTPPFALNILDFLAFMLVKAGVHDDDDGGRDDDDDDANDDDDDGDKNDCACEYYFGVWSRSCYCLMNDPSCQKPEEILGFGGVGFSCSRLGKLRELYRPTPD